MIRRLAVTALLLLAVAVFVAALVCIPTGRAHAADHRPCVSKAEFYGLRHGQTRAQVEARWEVSAAVRDVTRGDVRVWVTYPLCGYDDGVSGVSVAYGRFDHLWRVALVGLLQDGTHS